MLTIDTQHIGDTPCKITDNNWVLFNTLPEDTDPSTLVEKIRTVTMWKLQNPRWEIDDSWKEEIKYAVYAMKKDIKNVLANIRIH